MPSELDMAMEWTLYCSNKLKLIDIEAGKILLYFSRITIIVIIINDTHAGCTSIRTPAEYASPIHVNIVKTFLDILANQNWESKVDRCWVVV